jgi:hypothetical protein
MTSLTSALSTALSAGATTAITLPLELAAALPPVQAAGAWLKARGYPSPFGLFIGLHSVVLGQIAVRVLRGTAVAPRERSTRAARCELGIACRPWPLNAPRRARAGPELPLRAALLAQVNAHPAHGAHHELLG